MLSSKVATTLSRHIWRALPTASAATSSPASCTADWRRNHAKPIAVPSVSSLHSSPPSSAKRKGPSAGKNKSEVERLLDEMSDSDSDDEADARRGGAASTMATGVPNTAAAKFIEQHADGGVKHKKKDSKSTKSKGKSAHLQSVSYAEVRRVVDVEGYWTELQAEVDAMTEHLARHVSVRSAAAALDDLPVPLEGDEFPLKEVATLNRRDPKRIVVDCASFPQATKAVLAAIRDAGMNLNPQQDGTRIYVPIPKVTREHRERLAKGVKTFLGETKERLRKIESKYLRQVNDLPAEKSSHIPKDTLTVTKDLLLSMERHFAAEADRLAAIKQKDVLGGEK